MIVHAEIQYREFSLYLKTSVCLFCTPKPVAGRVKNSLIDFSSDSLVFCERKSDALAKKSKLLPSLFCHDQPEQIAHGRSFVKSEVIESLMSLFNKERLS